MITSESNNKKFVLYDDAEAREHDTEFMTAALEQANMFRGKQGLYGSRSREDLMELFNKVWQHGMRREWKEQRAVLITLAAVAARNDRVAYALAHPELCTDVLPKPALPGKEPTA